MEAQNRQYMKEESHYEPQTLTPRCDHNASSIKPSWVRQILGVRSPGLKTFSLRYGGAGGFDVPTRRLNPAPRIDSSSEKLHSALYSYGVQREFLFEAIAIKLL